MPTEPPCPASADGATEPQSDWDRKRRAIVNGAAQVFFARGFKGGTTRDIAELVGLSQPTIYHYVGSKNDLMAAIALQVNHDFEVALDAALTDSSPDDPVDRLRRLIHRFVDTLVENQQTFAVYWKEQESIPADLLEQTHANELRFVAVVDEVVRGAQDRGALPANQPAHIITEAILGMTSWLYWWYKPDGRYGPEEIADAFCDLIGLGGEQPSRTARRKRAAER